MSHIGRSRSQFSRQVLCGVAECLSSCVSVPSSDMLEYLEDHGMDVRRGHIWAAIHELRAHGVPVASVNDRDGVYGYQIIDPAGLAILRAYVESIPKDLKNSTSN